ncbi:hypothetical protein A2U01_0118789, partial [Trifolium medium]|nr:hypothetical protein [Trifolium medium]
GGDEEGRMCLKLVEEEVGGCAAATVLFDFYS